MPRHITKGKLLSDLFLALMGMVLFVYASAGAYEPEWPREIDVPEGHIEIYQPQLESFKGDKLTARMAVSVTKKGETEPVFGAIWVKAWVSTDRETRMVTLLDLDVTAVNFPNADPDKVQKLTAILESKVPRGDLSISLDRLLVMLDLVEKEKKAAENFKSIPPKIIFSTHPAVLVMIDGEPKLGKVEGSDLMRVVNTPFFIVLDVKTTAYYLKGEGWLTANDVMGPWQSESARGGGG